MKILLIMATGPQVVFLPRSNFCETSPGNPLFILTSVLIQTDLILLYHFVSSILAKAQFPLTLLLMQQQIQVYRRYRLNTEISSRITPLPLRNQLIIFIGLLCLPDLPRCTGAV